MANPTQNGVLKKDDNAYPVMGGTSSVDNSTIVNSAFDPVTRRLLTDMAGGSGSVTSVSVVTANGFAGTVATATTTPAITMSTTVTGVLVGNGTAVAAAVSGTDLKTVNGTSIIGSGNIVTPAGTVTSVSGTTNRITSTGGATPVIDISATFEALLGKVASPLSQFASTTSLQLAGVISDETGSGSLVFANTPTLVTPVLGVATATSINKMAITAPATSSTLAVADGKTLTANSTLTLAGTDSKTLTISNSLTLAGTDSTTMTFPSTSASIARTDAAQTFTGTQTFSQTILTANAITASSNAATVPVTSGRNIVTNNSAATLTITMTTTSAVNMQTCIVQILDASAVAQTISWVNTENSTLSVPTTSNGSTTLPLTVGFIYNSATSKWRCVTGGI